MICGGPLCLPYNGLATLFLHIILAEKVVGGDEPYVKAPPMLPAVLAYNHDQYDRSMSTGKPTWLVLKTRRVRTSCEQTQKAWLTLQTMAVCDPCTESGQV